jgi:hypothetical protein
MSFGIDRFQAYEVYRRGSTAAISLSPYVHTRQDLGVRRLLRLVLDAIVKRLDDALADCARQLAVGTRNGLAFDIMSITP